MSLLLVDESLSDRRRQHRTEAEPADSQPGDESALVGEPLLQHGDRDDVREAEPETADDAIAEDEQPELIVAVRERREDDADAIDDAPQERDPARSLLVLQSTADIGADEDHADRHLERQRPFQLAEVEGLGDAQRLAEHAPGIDGADRKLKQQSRNDQPPAPLRGALFVCRDRLLVCGAHLVQRYGQFGGALTAECASRRGCRAARSGESRPP
jgi:hypothetical protein